MRDVYFGRETSKLHGVLLSSETPGAPAAVICHPHPQFGGSMNNNVVLGVETVLADAGFTTLRFNFRGVGLSKGTFSDGSGEQEDVIHAINFLAADTSVGSIHFVGYSFGAMVGLRAAIGDDRTASLTGIAPPTVMDSFDFLAENSKPLLAIAGSQDDFCDIQTLKPTIKSAGGHLEILPGADHFLMGFEHKTGEFVKEFLESLA